MAKMVALGDKNLRIRALLPSDRVAGVWYPLPNGFFGMILPNGSIELRRKVNLLGGGDSPVWRVDRVSAAGKERFIGYQPLTALESALNT
jgi:hypothetical protein